MRSDFFPWHQQVLGQLYPRQFLDGARADDPDDQAWHPLLQDGQSDQPGLISQQQRVIARITKNIQYFRPKWMMTLVSLVIFNLMEEDLNESRPPGPSSSWVWHNSVHAYFNLSTDGFKIMKLNLLIFRYIISLCRMGIIWVTVAVLGPTVIVHGWRWSRGAWQSTSWRGMEVLSLTGGTSFCVQVPVRWVLMAP